MIDTGNGAAQGAWFELGERRIIGELQLSGEQTRVSLVAPDPFDLGDQRCLLGTRHDLKKLSLLNCVCSEPKLRWAGGEQRHVQLAYPEYVLIGDRHLSPADQVIEQVSLLVDDAEALFPDHDAFGMSSEPERHIAAIADEYRARGRRPLRRGEDPMVFFFGGEREIVSVETAIGQFFVQHRHHLLGSQHLNGLGFENQTWFGLKFPDPVSLDIALEGSGDLLRFVEIIAGRPQNLERLRLYAPMNGKPASVDAHWLYRPRRASEWEHQRVSNIDLLINSISEREAFERVLKRWLDMDPERKAARARASETFGRQRSFHPDRLVAAANMFDHLPGSALPPKPTLSEELLQARAQSKALFKALPDGEERTSILQALGRVGTLTLRRKIAHRAAIVNGRIAPKLSHLDLVVREAVNLRNYFVHGSPPGFDYEQYSGISSFLTEALEFLFTASDLVDSGWNIQKWYSRYSSLSHPFKALVKCWDDETAVLARAVEEAKAKRSTTSI